MNVSLLGIVTWLLMIMTSSHAQLDSQSGLVHQQTFTGEVGAENFTYYKFSFAGRALIRLVSLSGDADLYASTSTLRPGWADYTMTSATCGVDEVIVEAHHSRPVGVAVYGYITHPTSSFQLSVFLEPDTAAPIESPVQSSHHHQEEEDEEEVIGNMRTWTLLIGLLQAVLDFL